MTIATKAARPRTTHPEHNGAYDNGAQDSGVVALDAALDAALVRLTDTDAARISETATAGILQASNAAGVNVTSLMGDLTMIVRPIVRLALELFGGVATESGTAVGFNVDDDQHADICFGDPLACV